MVAGLYGARGAPLALSWARQGCGKVVAAGTSPIRPVCLCVYASGYSLLWCLLQQSSRHYWHCMSAHVLAWWRHACQLPCKTVPRCAYANTWNVPHGNACLMQTAVKGWHQCSQKVTTSYLLIKVCYSLS